MKVYRILKKSNWALAAFTSIEGWSNPDSAIRGECEEIMNIGEGIFTLIESEDYLGYEIDFEEKVNGWVISNIPSPTGWGKYECPKEHWLKTAKMNVNKYMYAVKKAESKNKFINNHNWNWPWDINDASHLPYKELPTYFDRNDKCYIHSGISIKKFIFIDYKYRTHFVNKGTKIWW